MKASLRIQISFFLGLLVLIIVALAVMSRLNQSELIETEENLASVFSVVEQIFALERDVIDLQRNLLIFKETASDSSSERFQELMREVISRLELIEASGVGSSIIKLDEGHIQRMRGHLEDYNENFEGVIEFRKGQELLYSNVQDAFRKIDALLKLQQGHQVENKDMLEVRQNIIEARFHISAYLLSPSLEHTSGFKAAYANLSHFFLSNAPTENEANALINEIKRDFNRLTQTTRGYIFLVNVVMAGSANEFLFLTKQLREAAINYQGVLREQATILSKSSRVEVGLFSGISILIAVVIAFIVSTRIMAPISSMTRVFKSLSNDESVDTIPGAERADEIGALAKAAEIFNSKNKQTAVLLEATRSMSARRDMLNKALELEKKRAEEAAASKSMFLANMSHEIRTPMNGIVGLVDLALKTELTEQQREYLENIAYSGQIMMNVINDILDVSKIEAGKLEIENVEFAVENLIDNLIQLLKAALGNKALSLKITVSPEVPKILKGDPLRISQVILNLCGNSIKFTEQGGVYVEFSYEQQAELLQVAVRDTGIGIDAENLNKVFESFTQSDGSTSRKYGGTGLGLTIVKQLTSMMGGDVKAASRAGEGSTFTASFHAAAIGTDPIIARIDNSAVAIKYLCRPDSPNFPLDMFVGLKVPVERINELDLANSSLSTASNVLLVDVVEGGLDHKLLELLREWSNKGGKIGVLYDSYFDERADDPSRLEGIANVHVLSHPVSPAHVTQFLGSLLDEPSASQNTQKPLEREQHAEHDGSQLKGHVLLVEDNPVNQLVAGTLIEQQGLSYDLAEDGQQAVNMVCSGTQYDFVLMDIQMPVMDGYQATSTLRDKGFGELKICGLSANAMKEHEVEALEAGMNDYITKPINPKELQDIIYKYLA
jgi:two-component system, sensor histidine kinase SagS